MPSRYKKNKKEIQKIAWEKNKNRIKIITLIVVPIIVFLFIWGKFIGVNILKTNFFDISSSGIPNSFNNVKIIQFSDLHYGITNPKKLDKIVDKINSYEADIVIFTGDLIDSKYKANDDDYKYITDNLSKIRSNLGKYAILGNEDYSNDNYDSIMYDSDFKLLKNNYDLVYNTDNNPILLYGFDDYLKGVPNDSLLNKKEVKSSSYKIALIHEPDYAEEIANGLDIDTIISGHSLYGQVKVPFIKPFHLPKGAKEYYDKEYDINGTKLYISGGCGQSLYNFRLGTVPSVNVYNLKSSSN